MANQHGAAWARHTAQLAQPDGGGTCYVLGTAHISALAAEEAAALIRAVRPHAVVVELDAERYRMMQMQRAHAAGAADAADASPVTRGDSAAKLARLMWRGDFVNFAGAVAYQIFGAISGSQPGAEFTKAIEAAEEVGATLVLGDRDARITMARLRARLRAAAASSPRPSRPPHGGAAASPLPKGGPVALMRAAGCAAPEAVLAAATRLLRDATAATPRVSPADLAAVRACFVTVVEHVRDRELCAAAAAVRAAGGTPPALADDDDDALVPGQPEREQAASAASPGGDAATVAAAFELASGLPPAAAAAVQQTLVKERDLWLARSLQLPAAAASGGSVVAVVGAGHVGGIAREWAAARTPAGYARSLEYAKPLPADAPPPSAGGTLAVKAAGALALGALGARKPRLFAKLAVGTGVMSGLVLAGAAGGVRTVAAAIEALHAADAQLRDGGADAQAQWQ